MTFKFRKDANNGPWCSILLPLCFIPFLLKYNIDVYLQQFGICLTCCLYSLLTKEGRLYNSYINGIFRAGFSILLSIVLSYCFSYSVTICFIICYISLWYYSYLVKNLLSYCSGSFTLGEAQAISQGVILFLHCCTIICLNRCNVFKSLQVIQAVSESVNCLQILLLGTVLLVQTLYSIPVLRQGVKFFISCFAVLFIMMFAWQIILKKNIFVWLWTFCIHSKTRVTLILFWIFCTFASVLVVIMTNKQKTHKSSTITRKYFHLIINAIYIPGIVYDLELLRFASVVALTIFILLEVCRILNVPIIGPMIQDAFQVFLDDKDSGFLILTHIYLLIGCSSPFWISGYHSDTEGINISLFSGVISVGFGDTAAAIGGTLFGRHNWKGSKKTYEGSICAFTVQLIVSLYFLSLGHLFSTWNVLLVAIAIFLTSLLEAKTTQVDNLVLPLFLFSIISWIQ